MGAPETALSRVAGILSATRTDLRSDLDRMEDAEDCRSFLADLCKSLPLDLLAFHSDPQDRVQLSPGYRALDAETQRLVAWAGWGSRLSVAPLSAVGSRSGSPVRSGRTRRSSAATWTAKSTRWRATRCRICARSSRRWKATKRR